MPADIWAYFEAMTARIREQSPTLNVPSGDAGVRRVLAAWLEAAALEAPKEGGDWQPGA